MSENLRDAARMNGLCCTVQEAIFLRTFRHRRTGFDLKGDQAMATQDVKVRKAYRQGDLVFIPLDAQDMANIGPDPKGTSSPRWNKLKTNVLREGEATGHKHEVLTQNAGMAAILAPSALLLRGLPHMDLIGSEDRMLVADEPVEIVHPEHKTIRLPIGVFLVVVQREYDEVKARRIMD